jgi:hypothetical protein
LNALAAPHFTSPFATARGIPPTSISVVHLTLWVASKAQVEFSLTTPDFWQLLGRFDADWALIREGQFDAPWNESFASAPLSQVSSGFAQGVIWSLQTAANVCSSEFDVSRKKAKGKLMSSEATRSRGSTSALASSRCRGPAI